MSKKSQTYLLMSLALFLLVLGVFGYALHVVSKKESRYDESKKLIGEYEAKEASFNKVGGLLASTKDDRQLLGSYFLREKDTISFISGIEKNAQNLGVTLNTNELSILPIVTAPGAVSTSSQLSVGFDYSGTETNVRNVTKLFENMPYHKKITNFSLVKVDENTWKASVKMLLTLRYD